MQCITTLKYVHDLSAEERTLAGEILFNLGSGEEDQRKAVVCLCALSRRLLFAICADEMYADIRIFCETSDALSPHWLKYLKSVHLGFSVVSVDRTVKFNAFVMMRGYYYYCCYEEAIKARKNGDAAVFFEWALAAGIPYALRDHLTAQAGRFLALHQRESEEKYAISTEDYGVLCKKADEMLVTACELGNRFWSAGYFSAGVILERAALDFAFNPDQKNYIELFSIQYPDPLKADKEQYPLSLRLMMGAMRNYFAAWLLENTKQSFCIMQVFKPKGLFSESKRVPDWNALYNIVFIGLQDVFRLKCPGKFAQHLFDSVKEELKSVLPSEKLELMSELESHDSEKSPAFGL